METFIKFEGGKHNDKPSCHSNRHNYLLGVVFVLIGAALILKNMGFFPYPVKNIIFSWQMLLVVIGLTITLSSSEKTGGLVVMAVGAFFLIPKIFRETYDINVFWPVIFIIVGLIIIFSRRQHSKKKCYEAITDDNFIDIVNIFSGCEKQIMSDNFSGGKITSIFGGSEIDFTQAKLASGVSVLEITCIFGGTSLILPSDWNVKVDVTPVLGGFEERRVASNRPVDTSKQLLIKGTVMFGGGEIKRY